MRGLRFTLDANRVLDTAAALAADDEPLKVQAARNLQANWESNRAFLDTKFAAFTGACWALGAQVVFWGLLLVAKEVM